MCTLVAKKFPHVGWVGVKNRDRPAPTHSNLLRDRINSIERVAVVDEDTSWSEGMNSHGVSIISSSLSAVVSGSIHTSKDGLKIRDALTQTNVKAAVDVLVEHGICGNVLVFDRNSMWCIEGETGDHKQVVGEVTEDWIARTNHGVWLPSAGYQRNSGNRILEMRRIGSQARLLIANYIAQTAQDANQLMTMMAQRWSDEPQINTIRTPVPGITTRTTEQLMLEPGRRMVLVRNVNGTLEFDQREANTLHSDVLVGII